MTKSAETIEDSIQLALDAAVAANDSAEDASRLKGETFAAAARLDAFGKSMRPAMWGTLAGALVATALGGVVYFKALSDLQVATAAQLEALTLFSQNVSDLSARMDAYDDLDATLAALADGRDIDQDVIREVFTGEFEAFQDVLAARDAEVSDAVPQMLRSIAENTTQEHESTREFLTTTLSDLQLALTRVMAEQPAERMADAETGQEPRAVAPAPTVQPRRNDVVERRPAPRPAPNPFKFP
ncbi:MAG: hypothetical protein AAF576_05185 [Pseudomonadota bacterium]